MRSILAVMVLSATLSAQQLNAAFSALALDTQASQVVGLGPTTANVWTDSSISAQIRGAPATPFAVFGGTLNVGSFLAPGVGSFDLAGPPTLLLDGFSGAPAAVTDFQGFFSAAFVVDSCGIFAPGTCAQPASFNLSFQALVTAPSAPFGVTLTGAVTAVIANGHTELVLADAPSFVFDFPPGMNFPFYGGNYTQTFISDDGFISFGLPDDSFASASVAFMQSGVPRIMSFFTDLWPEPTFASRTYAQISTDNGIRRLRVVHENLKEVPIPLPLVTPHGGEIVIWENGDIEVTVGAYNLAPATFVGVGITPGGNLGLGSLPSGTGLDLSASAGTVLTSNANGFELYNHNLVGATNPLDIAGVTIRFVRIAPFQYLIL